MPLIGRYWCRTLLAVAACVGAVLALVGTAAATPLVPVLPLDVPVVVPVLFAGPPPTVPGSLIRATNPDDITQLDDLIYVTFQNNAGKDGTPAGSFSTIAAYRATTGALVTTYQLPGRCDGLTAEPKNHRLLATVNEDLNSSLFVIYPGQAHPKHYTYSPDPAQTGSDGTNGGTDAISVAPDGTVYVAHSNPDTTLPAPNNAAAVYTLTLIDDTAKLTRLFGVNDTAEIVNREHDAPPLAQLVGINNTADADKPEHDAPRSAPLGLTDPDSNRFLGGDEGLVQDAQADSKLVFATDMHSGKPHLRQLLLTNAAPTLSRLVATPQLDDLARVDCPGRLFVVDQKADAIYWIDTHAVRPGTVFVSQPAPGTGDLPNDPALGVVNLRTGVVTHLVAPFLSPKGLLVVPSDEQHHQDTNKDD